MQQFTMREVSYALHRRIFTSPCPSVRPPRPSLSCPAFGFRKSEVGRLNARTYASESSYRPYSNTQWLIDKAKLVLTLKLVVGGLLLAVPAADVIYAYYDDWNRLRKIYSSFEKGSVGLPETGDDFIDRPQVVKVLQTALRPPSRKTSYDLVVGNHGAGKTTLVSKVAHDLDGVVYVDIPATSSGEFREDFGNALAESLNWSPPKTSGSIRLLEKLLNREKDQKKSQPMHKLVMKDFTEAAEKFRIESGRPPVLVFDNVNYMANKDPDLLWHFQQVAKAAADNLKFKMIFVCSDGRAPVQMIRDSAFSRVGKHLEIGDLTETEVSDYLKKRNIPETDIREIFQTVGGRIKQLRRVADELNAGEDLHQIFADMEYEVQPRLEDAGMTRSLIDKVIGWKIARLILRDGPIERETFYDICGKKTADNLLTFNIFALRRGGTVGFESQIVEAVIKKKLEESKIAEAKRLEESKIAEGVKDCGGQETGRV